MPSDAIHGLLVIDKPLGMTSRAAVDRAQRWFRRGTKLGHTGTLDPLATGVLVLCVGHATRLTEFVQEMPKTYVAEVTLGARSATDDGEGPITPVAVPVPPDRPAVDAALQTFIGLVAQVPPAFSAAKLGGQRSYDVARRGGSAELSPRTVRIDRIDVLEYRYPVLRLEVRCGKGTYIRSLARDVGEGLGCGGYVSSLRRTQVGPLVPDQAVPLDADPEAARARLLPVAAAVVGLPSVTVDEVAQSRFRSGQSVTYFARGGEVVGPDSMVAVFDAANDVIGVGRTDESGRFVRPSKVLRD
jgi:tRNA pseudouridine55 synthase